MNGADVATPAGIVAWANDFPAETPTGHTGTVNRRLLGPEATGGACDMFLASMEPGGEAEPHAHAEAVQVVYVLEGELEVRFGGEAPRRCGPGQVIRVPPRLGHSISNPGPAPVRALVAFTPPLPRPS